jgi:hypothetical protein
MKRIVLITILALAGCSDGQSLGETEAAEINRILKTGVGHPDDPYVRAETHRVIELLADPALADYADDGLDDESPMVRVASLRSTLASGADGTDKAATRVFTRGDAELKRAVLNAVAEYDTGPSRRELLGRALRSDDPALRRIAFEAHHIARVDEAVEEKDEKALKANIYPELGRFIGLDKDPVLAAQALRKFLELGQDHRADSLIKKLADENAELDDRVRAARILVGAHAEPAAETFHAIVERHKAAMADDSLGVPEDVVPPELRRWAILGTVATGDSTYIKDAQDYLNEAKPQEAVQVLEALGPNPGESAAISVKVAMQDARRPVRLRAIELYEQRDDAKPKALIAALKGADYEMQKRLARVLFKRFRKEWIDTLRSDVQRRSKMIPTMELLRDVVTTKEEVDALIKPLRQVLQKVRKEEDGRRAALASYFLAISADSAKEAKLAAETLDEPTRYSYLEFLVRTNPSEHVETFRKYFYDDMFVIRLISAAGLWRVLGAES